VVIDLQEMCAIYAIAIWYRKEVEQQRVRHGLSVELDYDFGYSKGSITAFRNDSSNSSYLSSGLLRKVSKAHDCLLIAVKGEPARLVRCYGEGSTLTRGDKSCVQYGNKYREIEVWGHPLKQ